MSQVLHLHRVAGVVAEIGCFTGVLDQIKQCLGQEILGKIADIFLSSGAGSLAGHDLSFGGPSELVVEILAPRDHVTDDQENETLALHMPRRIPRRRESATRERRI